MGKEIVVWQLRCFGGLGASNSQRTIERFRTQKTAALLALLALRGARQREEICALLWPDTSPESARNSLSVALSALRRELGDEAVRADRYSVALTPGVVETDVNEFDAALKSEDFARAVELYTAHLLPGFYEDPFPEIANEYQEKARGAFGARLQELEDNGEAEELLSLSRRAASLFGADERWFLAQIRGYYGLGDFDAALRSYDALSRLARKNGDTASESARLLAKSIRRDREDASRSGGEPQRRVAVAEARVVNVDEDSSLLAQVPVPVPAPLPRLWTRFFGREAERTMLGEWLRGGENLVTLSGAGGSGKTRLALETLHELSEDWRGDIAFVSLAALSDAELIVPAVRDALGLTATPDGAPLDQIERALKGRRTILLLDNFEQLVEGGAGRLQTLRERLPNATFLVTSRVLLQLPGEREFPVAPLPTPLHNTSASQVRDCASAALFCDRAGLMLDEGNAGAVGGLCRRLDGIPLALELAAARAKVLSPSQILERLQKHPDFLQSRQLGLPARHKTLRATIEWSTELLSPELRAFWARLSLFHDGWTLEAAERIAAPGICEALETLDFLTQLRECSLVFTLESGGEARFRMLQTLREFGREALQESEEVERHYFEFFLELATRAASAMQGAEQTLWLARLDAEQDNLRAALSWARQHDAPRGLQLATSLIDFWETRLSLDEGRGWIETFLREVERTPASSNDSAPQRSRALSGAGRLAYYGSDIKASRDFVLRGLDAAREAGDIDSFVCAVAAFVRFAMSTGDDDGFIPQSRVLSEEAVARSRQAGEQAHLLESLTSLSYAQAMVGHVEEALTTTEEAIALGRELNDDVRLVRVLNNHASMNFFQGRFDTAHAVLDESLSICRRLGAPWELIVVLWALSDVAREQGELDVAVEAATEMLETCRLTPAFRWGLTNVLFSTGYLLVRLGNARGAALLLGAGDALGQAVGYHLVPVLRGDFKRHLAQARTMLNEMEWEEHWRKGRAMTPEQAIEFGLQFLALPSSLADSLEA